MTPPSVIPVATAEPMLSPEVDARPESPSTTRLAEHDGVVLCVLLEEGELVTLSEGVRNGVVDGEGVIVPVHEKVGVLLTVLLGDVVDVFVHEGELDEEGDHVGVPDVEDVEEIVAVPVFEEVGVDVAV
eukprot:gb/GECG01001253.1/.p1 GENE.gb/GECG01001253.1/~~gb/GECG01001253.1/.p1  ORF type:complete len:129 (+),score=22.72 gb/GECG01001253.1/:1-387(+)